MWSPLHFNFIDLKVAFETFWREARWKKKIAPWGTDSYFLNRRGENEGLGKKAMVLSSWSGTVMWSTTSVNGMVLMCHEKLGLHLAFWFTWLFFWLDFFFVSEKILKSITWIWGETPLVSFLWGWIWMGAQPHGILLLWCILPNLVDISHVVCEYNMFLVNMRD